MKLSYSYHIVQNSPWPFLISFNLLSFLLRLILLLCFSNSELTSTTFSFFLFDVSSLTLRFFFLLCTSFFWFSNIFQENKIGFHTVEVTQGLFLGLLLFILSEICLFFSFFFAYFFNSLVPDPSVGSIWPPFSISPLDFQSIPLLNTFLLLSSGFTLTAAHHSAFQKKFSNPNSLFSKIFPSPISFGLVLTLLLGLLFSSLQILEYFSCSFTFIDSVYGSSFFVLTGTHGLHILLGSFFLFFSFFSSPSLFSPSSFGSSDPNCFFSFASVYWHFVDVVWLFLFFFLYCL